MLVADDTFAQGGSNVTIHEATVCQQIAIHYDLFAVDALYNGFEFGNTAAGAIDKAINRPQLWAAFLSLEWLL